MKYRVENKYLVTDRELEILGNRLKSVMFMDSHQIGDCYEIRSVYYDDFHNSCMDENESGVDQREKYRIRIYDPQGDVIHLEIKEKTCGFTRKESCDLSRCEAIALLAGEVPMLLDERKPLNKLQIQMRCRLMRPKIVVAYERTAFIHPVGNVRVTFDRNIMASRCCEELFEDRVSDMVPVLPKGIHVLEVKYDEFLPDFIAQQLEIGCLQETAFSKYYMGRLAVQGDFPVDLEV